MTENRLLKRQLKKSKIRSFEDLNQESFNQLLTLVERSYNDYEEDKSLYENVAELASQEFQGLNSSLERKVTELEKINTNIRDSLEYASLMQQAILPSEELLDNFFNEHFICWQPRDIVGGDIYLIDTFNHDEILVMVIDGSGHGVSGAFLTMLVKAIEGQIMAKIKEGVLRPMPSLILEYFNRSLKTMLQQDKGSTSNSGFDGGILYYNKATKVCRYAGAKTPLYIVQNNTLEIIRSDRKNVGFVRTCMDQTYMDYDIDIQPGTKLYIATDGIIDQEGMSDEKFGLDRFKRLLIEQSNQPFKEQYRYLKGCFMDFKGDRPQLDDITVVGLNLS